MGGSEGLFEALLDTVEDAVFLFDPQGNLSRASLAAARQLGYDPAALLARTSDELFAATSVGLLPPGGEPAPITVNVQLMRRDGSHWDVRLRTRRLPTGHVLAVASETRASGGRDLDPLTQLAGRPQLERRLATLSDMAVDSVGCFFIDLDHFKQVNDRHGHLVGDELLRVVARRVRGCFRPGDLVARYGGDELVALVAPCTAETADAIGSRILASLSGEVDLRGERVELSVSVGIARGRRADEALLHRADQAMYSASCAGRGRLAHADTPIQAR